MRHILKGQCMEGAFLKSIFTKKRACGCFGFQKRTALFNTEELHGESQNASVLPVQLQRGKETCSEGSPSLIERVSVAGHCACPGRFLSFLVRFC